MDLHRIEWQTNNGGKLLNWHVANWLRGRPHPVALSRLRPYRKHNNAHIEQRNYSQVRLWFGYEHYDAPGVFKLSTRSVAIRWSRF